MRTLLVLAICLFAFAGSARADDQLTPDQIRSVVSLHASEIKDCYVDHALGQKGATGKVTLDLIVKAEGKVDRVAVDAPGVRGHAFSRCVQVHARTWEFPLARHATEVQYPFMFQHTRAPGAGPVTSRGAAHRNRG